MTRNLWSELCNLMHIARRWWTITLDAFQPLVTNRTADRVCRNM